MHERHDPTDKQYPELHKVQLSAGEQLWHGLLHEMQAPERGEQLVMQTLQKVELVQVLQFDEHVEQVVPVK